MQTWGPFLKGKDKKHSSEVVGAGPAIRIEGCTALLLRAVLPLERGLR